MLRLPAMSWTAFGSRFARRMFLLFVLAAVVPLIATGLLVHYQYGKSSESDRQAQMRQSARDFGQSALDRLLSAERTLEEWWSVSDVIGTAMLESAFESITLASIVTERQLLHGKPFSDPIPDTWWQTQGMRIASTQSSVSRDLFLIKSVGEHEILIAMLDSEFVWSPASGRPAGISLAVFTHHGPLMETKPLPRAAIPAIRATIAEGLGTELEDRIAWKTESGGATGVFWELFLRSRFEGDNWIIIAASEDAVALTNLTKYSSVATSTLTLTLGLIILLSSSQIRRYLTPLEQLMESARRIANRDFDHPVDIRSGDEFEDLGNSINNMSSRLGRQFSALQTLSQIDTAILKQPELQTILGTILQSSLRILPTQELVLLVNHDDVADRMQVYSATSGEPGQIGRVRLTPKTSDWVKHLPSDQEGAFVALPDMLRGLVGEAKYGIALTVKKANVLLALTLIVPPSKESWDEDSRHLAIDINRRLAVALAAIDREEALFTRANYDGLTGLPNRQLLYERIERQLASAHRSEQQFALMFLDLDHFKLINDSMGHSAGDLLLTEVAGRIEQCIKATDTVARIGGDEFVVLLGEVDRAEDIEIVAHRIQEKLDAPIRALDRPTQVGASIGIAIYPSDGQNRETLLRNADMAMYQAKDLGRGRIAYFEQSMNDAAMERVILKEDLQAALTKEIGLSLVYQPQLDLVTGQCCGVEALTRWSHPELGNIRPDKFIAIAEATGLIENLGAWVIRTACTQIRDWNDRGVAVPRVSINVSGREITNAGFVEQLMQALSKYGTKPDYISLEVTETALIQDLTRTASTLAGLREEGIAVSIDDFGTGYSSLSYLQDLPADELKIDKSFVDRLSGDKPREATAIISAIVHLADAMNQVVVAEGVEELKQATTLRELGCHVAQGYLYAKPMNPEALESWMQVSRMGRYGTTSQA